ncbi:MAG TPA: choice-of-anchor R domain-containing protein [Candidatus Acidoferrales bacterium]|nr:choice-of-anchor R domain-containing protein [Candidatus Acidoferrales bacterium]
MAIAKRAFLLIALVGLVFVGTGRGDELFNNLGAVPDGADPTGSDWGPLADSFSTGSTAFDLNSLTVALSGTRSAGTTTAYLLSDSSSTPGSVLEKIGSISEADLSSAPGFYTLSTSYVLSPETMYWIELTSDNNSAGWDWSFDASGTGVAAGFFGNFQGNGAWVVFPNDNGPYQMELAGRNEVPEPSSIVLLFAGFTAILCVAFRRRLAALKSPPSAA